MIENVRQVGNEVVFDRRRRSHSQNITTKINVKDDFLTYSLEAHFSLGVYL